MGQVLLAQQVWGSGDCVYPVAAYVHQLLHRATFTGAPVCNSVIACSEEFRWYIVAPEPPASGRLEGKASQFVLKEYSSANYPER